MTETTPPIPAPRTGGRPSTLTPRQERFIAHYCATLNGTAAAKAAGFSQKHAHRYAAQLLTMPDVQEDIRCRLQVVGPTEEYIQASLFALCEHESPLVRLRALEILCKVRGLFRETEQSPRELRPMIVMTAREERTPPAVLPPDAG
jgi:hypothetical protein